MGVCALRAKMQMQHSNGTYLSRLHLCAAQPHSGNLEIENVWKAMIRELPPVRTKTHQSICVHTFFMLFCFLKMDRMHVLAHRLLYETRKYTMKYFRIITGVVKVVKTFSRHVFSAFFFCFWFWFCTSIRSRHYREHCTIMTATLEYPMRNKINNNKIGMKGKITKTNNLCNEMITRFGEKSELDAGQFMCCSWSRKMRWLISRCSAETSIQLFSRSIHADAEGENWISFFCRIKQENIFWYKNIFERLD